MARGIQRRLRLAQHRVTKDIRALSSGGKFAGGLGSEGWLGGYQAALSDVQLLLNGVEPNGHRSERYWESRISDDSE